MNLLLISCLLFYNLVSIAQGVFVHDCGGKTLKVHNVMITPDELRFPGRLSAAFDLEIKQEFDGEFDIQFEVQKIYDWGKVLGRWWIPIPCFSFCSFHYDCKSLFNNQTCPHEVINWGKECSCPMKRMNVRVNNYEMQLPDVNSIFKIFIGGNIWAKMELIDSKSKEVHSCIEAYFYMN